MVKAPTQLVLFIKVVRPGEVQALYDLHVALGGAVPVAASPGGSDEYGLLVLQALPGETLGERLARDPSAAPPGQALLQLYRQLAPVHLGGEPRYGMAHKVANHAHLLGAVVPDEAEALDRFVEDYGEDRAQPLTTVHGDFHESQLLIDRNLITGLLDVDDAGPGQLVDDLALLTGRVWALAHFGKGNRPAIKAYAEHLLEAFGSEVDEPELRRRVAGALLGRATVPFRGQDPGWPSETSRRLRLAEDWLAHAT
jgi:Ser/Thr protein kinase RdoA (MazF antagonist)